PASQTATRTKDGKPPWPPWTPPWSSAPSATPPPPTPPATEPASGQATSVPTLRHSCGGAGTTRPVRRSVGCAEHRLPERAPPAIMCTGQAGRACPDSRYSAQPTDRESAARVPRARHEKLLTVLSLVLPKGSLEKATLEL